jgi:hypothetical protein
MLARRRAGVLKGDESATAGQGDRVLEWPFPARGVLREGMRAPFNHGRRLQSAP